MPNAFVVHEFRRILGELEQTVLLFLKVFLLNALSSGECLELSSKNHRDNTSPTGSTAVKRTPPSLCPPVEISVLLVACESFEMV